MYVELPSFVSRLQKGAVILPDLSEVHFPVRSKDSQSVSGFSEATGNMFTVAERPFDASIQVQYRRKPCKEVNLVLRQNNTHPHYYLLRTYSHSALKVGVNVNARLSVRKPVVAQPLKSDLW